MIFDSSAKTCAQVKQKDKNLMIFNVNVLQID